MINIGIVGYGNLGKGVEKALVHNNDMRLVAVFTRRDPKSLVILSKEAVIEHIDNITNYIGKIDVMILCGGSSSDLPKQAPEISKYFNIVDSFDTHAKIPEYFKEVNKSALAANKTAVISVGWDPGLFSIMRVLFKACLPQGNNYTFWGKGVSQGHSEAVRRVSGVKYATQYTIPKEEALQKVRDLKNPNFITKDKHLRSCYVVLNEGANKKEVEKTIKEMPNYFADYDTIVEFITEEEYFNNHTSMPHGGFVLRSGQTSNNVNQYLEFSLKLDSNPEFTSSVLIAYARACCKMQSLNQVGAKTVYDIPIGFLINETEEELRKSEL